MLTVDDYGAIRRARRDGLSIRQISRQFGHTRKTIRYVLNHGEPPAILTRERKAPLLGPVVSIIDRILADDEDAPPKQRHTAAQIHRRLRHEHDYTGGYAQVQRYVLKHRRQHRETFIPLGHFPGQRLEADFGHIHVDFPDGRRLVSFLVTAWAYSNAPFVIAFPFERTEAILEGMVAAFEFFGGVPKEVWWDNPKTVATLILKGRERQVHPRFAALASHHIFDPKFCMPARGNEKPDAESTVKGVQKRFATPVPRVRDLCELNGLLRQWCLSERDRVVQSIVGPFTIKDRLADDLAAALPLPKHRFEACVNHPAVRVDKYQTVAFDGNRYSVPRSFAFGLVTVKGFVDRVVIVSGGQVVATHERSLEKSKMILNPLHYLATLDRKPAALDHAPVFRDLKLPPCFDDFRARLERQHGTGAGTRQYVRVLQLLPEHPLTRLRNAIETCVREQLDTADAVIRRTKALAAIEAAKHPGQPTPQESSMPAHVDVPLPDLSRFNQLLGSPFDDSPVSVFYA
jgi:transposase